MLSLIVTTDERAGYIKLENGNLVITSDIFDATKFAETGVCLDVILELARTRFPDKKFYVQKASSLLFGTKPRRVVKEEELLNDSYFYSIISEFVLRGDYP